LTRNETTALMALIAEEHPKFLETANPEVRLELWHEALAAVPCEIALFAARRTLAESRFAPNLADLCQRIREIASPEGDDAIGAWNALAKAAARATAVTHEEFAALPYEARRFCGSLAGLRNLGVTDEETFATVTRGQFLKTYPGMRRSREAIESMPQGVLALVRAAVKPLPEKAAPPPACGESSGGEPEADRPIRPATTSCAGPEGYEPMTPGEWDARRDALLAQLEAAERQDRSKAAQNAAHGRIPPRDTKTYGHASGVPMSDSRASGGASA
jgi:hypothetical protein